MAIEIEKKYRITEELTDQVEKDLGEFGAEFLGTDFEENLLFGNEFLKEKKALLRVRRTAKKTILTFKQYVPNADGYKQHIEHETEVECAEAVEEIIKGLGFQKLMVYEKRRKTWRFRQVEVVLDELPFGLFIEIEGDPMAIAEAEMLLGAGDFEIEQRTYPFLTKGYGIRVENRIEARFGNKNG
jgi:adenylate cyclase class 2